MINRVILYVVGMLMTSTGVTAQQQNGTEIRPSIELLEYLGSLVEMKDDLIGPEFFDDGGAVDDQDPESSSDDSMHDLGETSAKRILKND